jgi:hypothetical protein
MDDKIEQTTDNIQADTGELSVQQAADVPDMPLDTSPGNGRYKQLSNGAVYDLEKKRIASIDNSINPHAITKENSQAMHQRRAELILEAQEYAREGIAKHLGKKTYLEAHGEMAGNMADLGKEWKSDPKQARASVEATRLAWQAAGVLAEGRNQGAVADVSASSAVLSVGADVLIRLYDHIQAAKQQREGSE